MTVLGSSPRAWGTLCPRSDRDLCRGLIPTGVGNTLVDQCEYRPASWYGITLGAFAFISELLGIPHGSGFAPACFKGGVPVSRLCSWPAHQGDAVEVNGLPLVVLDSIVKALFVVGGPNHQRLTCSGRFVNALPKKLPDSGADISNEHSCRNFNEPFGDVSPQACWAARQDYDDHDP